MEGERAIENVYRMESFSLGEEKDWDVAGGREHTGSSRFRGRKAEEKQTWKMSWGITLCLGHDRNPLVLLLRQAFLGTSPR